MKLNLDIYREVNETFRRLNNMRRWKSFVTEGKYNELAKQSLNSMVAYIIASYCEKAGQNVEWKRFPKIALYRAFNKAYVSRSTPQHIIDKLCEVGNVDRDAFQQVTRDIIRERTNHEFMGFISDECDTPEYQIFRAATKIATYVELLEQGTRFSDSDELETHMAEVKESLEEFKDMEGVKQILSKDKTLLKIISKISKLRNSNRWEINSYLVDCSVLGHLFDTAIFAYLIGLEEFDYNEEIATKMFFMGIFHDVPEAWTTDISSDVKDRISGLREATEIFEDMMMEEMVYKKVPKFLARKLKDVMFETGDNLQYKTLMKGADYLSADSECWRQYIAGSRELYYLASAIMGFDSNLITGFKARLTPIARELHNEMKGYAKQVLTA